MLHSVKEALRVKMASNEYITIVHEATNDTDHWGPTGAQMDDIAKVFHNGHEEIMAEIKLRLKDRNHSWRACYKSLLVVDHLARNIHETLLPVICELVPLLKQISQSFTCNEKGVDRGLSVRERSRKLVELLTDGALLREERAKADLTRRKVAGEPISMGSSTVQSAPAVNRAAYDSDENRSVTRTNGGIRSALREEQEKADMLLAMKLQQEEEQRAARQGVSIPYLHPDQTQRRSDSAPNNQEEEDHRLAVELQRRLDSGEPITPTVWNPPHSAAAAIPVARVTKPTSEQTDSIPVARVTKVAVAPPKDLDSLFDFSSQPPVAAVKTEAEIPNTFDPFAASAPVSNDPAPPTDFFDAFLNQRKDANKPTTTVKNDVPLSHQGLDLFSVTGKQPAAATTPDFEAAATVKSPQPVAPTVDHLFEQQIRGLTVGSAPSIQSRTGPTLETLISENRQGAW